MIEIQYIKTYVKVKWAKTLSTEIIRMDLKKEAMLSIRHIL